MKIAVMQPYFLPYVGYFQLISKVDGFVFLDDADYVRRGWIQRNYIVANGQRTRIRVPVAKRPIGTPIHEILLAENYPKWRTKFIDTLRHAYGKAPYFDVVSNLLKQVLLNPGAGLSELNIRLIISVCDYVGLDQNFEQSLDYCNDSALAGEARLIDICLRKGATEYVNAPGGRALYAPENFEKSGVRLRFLEPEINPYSRQNTDFIPCLSVLDMLMFLDPEEVLRQFNAGVISK